MNLTDAKQNVICCFGTIKKSIEDLETYVALLKVTYENEMLALHKDLDTADQKIKELEDDK